MRFALFWDLTHRRIAVLYRRFGETYQYRLQGSSTNWWIYIPWTNFAYLVYPVLFYYNSDKLINEEIYKLFVFMIMFYLLTRACGICWWPPCWWCFGLKWLISNNHSRFREAIWTTVATVPDIEHPDHWRYYTASLSRRIVSCSRRSFSMYTNLYSER